MRVQAYLGTTPPVVQTMLVNDLTARCVWLAHAVGLMGADAEVVRVVGSLERAQAALQRAHRLLSRMPASDTERTRHWPMPSAKGSWSAVLATRSRTEAEHFLTTLQTAVQQARAAGEAVVTDEDIDLVCCRLGAANSTLTRVCRLLSPADA